MKSQKNIVIKQIGNTEIVVYKDILAKAMLVGYESLMFNSGEVFLEVNGENDSLILETNGHVSIFDVENDVKYCDEERFQNDELMALIRRGQIYDSDQYEINEMNWFSAVYLEKNSKGQLKSVDDVLLEDIPSKIDDLIEYMLELYDYFSQ